MLARAGTHNTTPTASRAETRTMVAKSRELIAWPTGTKKMATETHVGSDVHVLKSQREQKGAFSLGKKV